MISQRFPYEPEVTFDNLSFDAKTVSATIGEVITKKRKETIDRVINGRTCNVSVMCERIYDTGNIAAVIRSMENLGFQKLDIVESVKTKTRKSITKGADKWVSIRKWKDLNPCVQKLKEEGYQIVATHLSADAVPMNEIDFTKPTVIVLGNEKDGVSEELLEQADANCVIPTYGFSQSFNISVAAAILLSHVTIQRKEKLGYHGDLSDEEKEIMRGHFYFKACGSSKSLLKNNH
jgi:tRNA (guanosine-2'-O-)-methyltransferase